MHLCYQTVYDFVATLWFKHATTHQTVCVNEFLAEILIVKHIEEYGNKLNLLLYTWQTIIQFVESIILLPFEGVEWIVGIEGKVEVERNEAELSSLL